MPETEETWYKRLKDLEATISKGQYSPEDFKKFLESQEYREYLDWQKTDYNTIHARKIKGFVAHFDILGFRSMIQDDDLDSVMLTYERLQRHYVSKVFNMAAERELFVPLNYSDTTLIYTTEISDIAFIGLLQICRFLFLFAYGYKVPIRGSITVGELYSSDRVALGKPIVDAYEKERMQDWIGCWISGECIPHITPEALVACLSGKFIVHYPIPFKDGDIKRHFALNWIFALTESFGRDKIKAEGFFEKKKNHGWAEERKHKNTRDFIDFIFEQK